MPDLSGGSLEEQLQSEDQLEGSHLHQEGASKQSDWGSLGLSAQPGVIKGCGNKVGKKEEGKYTYSRS